MGCGFKYRVLVADHDERLLNSAATALSREGYIVRIARNGFEALAELESAIPEVIVSSLEMPNMSGFEFLAVVRKRFPAIGVIARSSEFSPLGMPEGVLADRWIRKEENFDFELLEIIRELLSELPLRPAQAKPEIAPTWMPRIASGYLVITCPSCLRSSTVRTCAVEPGAVVTTTCIHCQTQIRYRVDSTSATTDSEAASSEKNHVLERQHLAVESSRRAISESKHAIAESRGRIDKAHE